MTQQGNPPPPGYPPQGYAPPPQGGYGYPPQQPPPQQPPQKKGKGCLIAALVTGGVVLVLCLVVGILVWKAAKKVGEIAKEGVNAPGTSELRAAGCDLALVMDMGKLSPIFDAGATATSGTASVVVACKVDPGHTAPTCDDVAQTYVKAASPGGTFMAQVQTQGKSRPDCQRVYSSTGALLREMR
jgi:hypothetical protein